MNVAPRTRIRTARAVSALILAGLAVAPAAAHADVLPPAPVAPGSATTVIAARPLSGPAMPAPVASTTSAKKTPAKKAAPKKTPTKKAASKTVGKKAATTTAKKRAASKRAATAKKSVKRVVRR